MISQRGFYLALAIALAAVLLLGAPTSILAQNGNETGLPLYPNATTGKQYPTNPEGYAIYTAESHDTLDAVEDWYRHALPKAKETQDNNQLTHGIVLTNGKDKVLVYRLGNSRGAVIELQKYMHYRRVVRPALFKLWRVPRPSSAWAGIFSRQTS